MDPKSIARGGARAALVAVLAYVNIKVWSCAIARNYCLLQSGLDYCECMQYADAGNNCSLIPGGPGLSCPPPPPPPANPRSRSVVRSEEGNNERGETHQRGTK
jgi:hypothetical protein